MFIRNALFFTCCLSVIIPALAVEPQETVYITELNDAQFESFIQTAEKPVIVDFWAPWCPPCMSMKPIFEEVAHELKEDYMFVTVNFDEGRKIAEKYGVTSIPTFKVIKNNAVVGTIKGSTGKESLIKQIENAVEGKITQETLLSAIQAGNKELVAQCLAVEEIDVNAITQINGGGMTVFTTPLITAVMSYLCYGQPSLDFVSMLLNAGADIDLMVDFPDTKTGSGFIKGSARSIAEEVAQSNIEEILLNRPAEQKAYVDDEMLRQIILNCKAKASCLLEFFKEASAK